MFNTIVLVTDLSSASNTLVECAIGLRALGVKKVVLTYAVAAQHLHDMRHLTAAKTNPFLLEQKKKLSEHGVEVVTRRARGMSAEDIERVAEEYSASLIVIASHDESIAEHVLFKFAGAVSAVLHGFTRPLLLVKTYVVNEEMECCLRSVTQQEFGWMRSRSRLNKCGRLCRLMGQLAQQLALE